MERLIKDASKMKDVQEKLGVTIDANSMSFDNIANAISVVQEKMGIAGTTQKEAMTTVSGSINATKAAWDNFMGALALGENVGSSLEGLVESALTAAANISKMALTVIKELPSALKSLLNKMTKDLIPQGIEAIKSLGQGMIDGIPQMLDNLLPELLSITDDLRELSHDLVNTGMDFLVNLAEGIAKGIPTMVAYLPQIISNIAGFINDNLPTILQKGFEIIVTLAKGLLDALPAIVANMGNIVKAAVDVFKAFNWLGLGVQIIEWIKNGINNLFKDIPNILKNIGESAINLIRSINWQETGSKLITFILNGIKTLYFDIPSKLFEIGKNAIEALIKIDWLGLGRDIVMGIVNGIKAFGSAIGDALIGMAKGAWDGAKKFLGIQSPSKLMRDTIGKNIPLGVAEGIDDEAETINIATRDMFDGIDPEISFGGIDKNIINQSNNLDIINILENYLPLIAEQKQVVLDTGTLVGEMASGINRKLGLIYNGQI